MTVEILRGDCAVAMAYLLAANSVDSIVTDPPYGLSFMGKRWDVDVPGTEVWAEALKVLKPGGYLLAFAGTRTYHRMAVAIEDAGFEIRDQIGWVYGSGFPKSHNGEWGGTALKPAWEPIVLARKALIGTVEKNFEQHGTGGLNIDGCRVGDDVRYNPPAHNKVGGNSYNMSVVGMPADASGTTVAGRWPANLIHDGSDEVVSVFPSAQGQQGATGKHKQGAVYGTVDQGIAGIQPRGDSGSAARFFYCAKASKADREAGLDGIPAVHRSNGNKWTDQDYHVAKGERPPSAESGPRRNTHPTVKPTDLMRYLCRLVTPPGGTVLDPFMGSGSTGKAAVLEGFRFIGCELSDEYADIAEARIAKATGEQS